MTRFHHRRAGFSLIELIVVISIISVLMALSAGAFFRVRNGQMNRASIATVNKVQGALENRVKAILASVMEDKKLNRGQWANAYKDAGNDNEIAIALLTYAKMKNELPMTVAEAVNPTTVGSITLAARAPFKTAFTGLTGATGTPEESGVCLFIALTTSGGDGAAAEGGLDQQTITTTVGNKSLQTFGDSYGTPLAFVRHCYGSTSTNELQSKPYVQTSTPKDPYDPSPNSKLFGALTGANAFRWNSIVQNAPSFAGMTTPYVAAKNHVPTVISAGQNTKWVSTGDIFTGEDNLYGFRLRREGSSGN